MRWTKKLPNDLIRRWSIDWICSNPELRTLGIVYDNQRHYVSQLRNEGWYQRAILIHFWWWHLYCCWKVYGGDEWAAHDFVRVCHGCYHVRVWAPTGDAMSLQERFQRQQPELYSCWLRKQQERQAKDGCHHGATGQAD